MSVFETLTKEHRLFDRLISRCEAALVYDEDIGREEIRNTLLVFLPALERHEELENLVFGHPSLASLQETRGARALMKSQHREVEALHADMQAVLADGGKYTFVQLKGLVSRLSRKLRAHFEMEETTLWPLYHKFQSRSLERSLDHLARQKLLSLQKEMSEYWEEIADYLGAVR